MSTEGISGRVIRISPANARPSHLLTELWRCRRLLYVFVWRDIKVRYKQTILGVAWTVLQPLLTMLVFTLVFGRLAKVPSGNVPYPVFVYCGLLPWQFFSQGLIRSGNSLVDNRYLLTKMYVPRIVVPLAAILSGVPDFAASFLLLIALMFHYRIASGIYALAVIPLIMLAALVALAFGLALATLNVRYRDVGYTVPFFAQLWFFVTPIAYPVILVPDHWRVVYALNPMTSVVESIRWALLGGDFNRQGTIECVLMVAVILVLSFFYFHREQRSFADLV